MGVNLIQLYYSADVFVVFVLFMNRTVMRPLPRVRSLIGGIILHIRWKIDELCILHVSEALPALSGNVDF